MVNRRFGDSAGNAIENSSVFFPNRNALVAISKGKWAVIQFLTGVPVNAG